MTTTVAPCSAPPPEDEDLCARLAREITQMIHRDKHACGDGGVHGLVYRYAEQIAAGAAGPGTETWRTHDKAFREQQKGIRNRLDDFNRNNCGSRVPLPQEAWKWATRPAPSEAEWRVNNPVRVQPADEPSPIDWAYWETLTGLTGAALVLYLIVSEGSRLFPPRNLVPVP